MERAHAAGLALVAFLAACSPVPPQALAGAASASDGVDAPSTVADPAWTYEVVASAGASELAIEAMFASAAGSDLTLDEGGRAYVRDVEVEGPRGWSPIAPDGDAWPLPEGAGPRRVRYRFLLARAGSEHDDLRVARTRRGAVESPPSTWLLRPRRAPEGTRFRFHVASAPGEAFATGIFPVTGTRDTYAGLGADMGMLPFAAFGALRIRAVEDDVLAVLLPGTFESEEDVLGWVRESARAVRGFYGRMPTPLVVFLHPARGSRVGLGTTMGRSGAAIAIEVGEKATRASLSRDWVLVHEMTHTALPEVARPQHWLEEGLATYGEPIARARAGTLSRERFWAEWIAGMPNGLPEPGDRGLDRTHTWGRTYWGGALFCLVADLEIRERTGGKKTLRDALLGILAAGGDISVAWPIERVIEVGDAATGVPVLRETYDRMKDAPVDVDLDSIWKRLGVAVEGESVTFDDAAPLASVREAMTRSG